MKEKNEKPSQKAEDKKEFPKDEKKEFRHERNDFRREFKREAKTDLNDIKEGDYFKGTVKILRKSVPGPVIFALSTGDKIIDGVTKESDFDTGDVIEVEGFISKRANQFQLEIKRQSKSSKNFDEILEKLSNPVRQEFSIKSERYDKMKKSFVAIAKRLRKAIFDNETILIRHHNDCDGITAGLSIEKSCSQLMEKIGLNPKFNIYRSPSKAPFYETADVFRDIVLSNRLENVHGQKKPLILVLDNGSTPEDRFAFKILKSLGYECIVIDHHNPVIIKNGKTSVCDYLSYHLNPYMFGLDSQTSAGMLCYELARFVNEDFESKIMPSIAGITDRCTIKETDDYIKMSGKTFEELAKMGVAIDFLAYNLKFDSGEGLFEKVYENPEFVELINEDVRKGVETQLQSTLPYLRTIEINGVTFSYIDLEKYTLRFTYPTPGKVLGLIHDEVAKGKENAVLTIGYLSDMIIIRATKPVLPVSKIISALRERIPQANVDGGGHEQAGTIKFVPAHLESIIEIIKDELKKAAKAE